MIELDPENRVSDRPADEANGGAIRLGGKTVCDPTVPADSAQVVGADQDKPDLPTRETVLSIAERLEHDPHFRGRSALLQIELVEETIILSGRLPSYYLKQLLQESVMLTPGVVDVENRVIVMRPNE